MEHTPGPWIDSPHAGDAIISKHPDAMAHAGDCIGDYGGYVVCEGTTKRDKPLIKAAPELLAVCENEVDIMLAVNEPRNGLPRHTVDYVHIGDELLEMEGPPLQWGKTRVGVLNIASSPRQPLTSYHSFELKGYQQWAGNWCWDRAVIRVEHLPRFLRVLKDAGWDCISGEASLFEMWKRDEVPGIEDLEKAGLKMQWWLCRSCGSTTLAPYGKCAMCLSTDIKALPLS